MKKMITSTWLRFAAAAFVVVFLSGAAIGAPVNDNFANATVINGSLPISVNGSNVSATAQAGEPHHTDQPAMDNPKSAHRSVWWSWTPNFSGTVTLTTEGSGSMDGGSDPFLDTQVGVYTGSSLGALTVVAKKEDSDGAFAHGWTRMTFPVTSGVNYKIAVDGWEAHQGRIKLNLFQGDVNQPPPANRYTLTVTVAPSAAGTVTLSPEQPDGGYTAGTVVTLTANGDGFLGWAGASTATSASTTITMTGNKNVTAVFSPARQIIFKNSSRQLATWFLDGTTFIAGSRLRNGQSAASGWSPMGVADLTGDGSGDIIFQHDDGRVAVWQFNGNSFIRSVTLRNGTKASGRRVAGIGDFNNDGSNDILFKSSKNILNIWFMNGTNFVRNASVNGGKPANSAWRPAGAGDINGDGSDDILFQASNGTFAAWTMTNGVFAGKVTVASGLKVGSTVRLIAPTDIDGDDDADLLFHNTSNGKVSVWLMDGVTRTGAVSIRNGASTGIWKPIGIK